MLKIRFLPFICLLFVNIALSQYWQQDVQYKINCSLDTKIQLITGDEILVYTNNSPDTLNNVLFHLYQNAYTPGSYFDQKVGGIFNPNNYTENDWGWTKLDEVKNNSDLPLQTSIDNTIASVKLDQPLLPGEKTIIKFKFRTKFSSNRHRMNYSKDQWGNTQYSVAQWYPKICVYDKFGWHDDQDFGHEFYGDFGTFDVNISLPAHYILDATGVLQNKDEALPDDLLKKIDVKNFKDKKYGEQPSIIIPETDQVKTWKFHAENVHDFAWIADPTFRRGYAEWNGIQVISYAREYKASRWQDAAEFTAKVIEIYSKDFGMYRYPKMIISDVDNGMEYPMLTMDGGESPSYYGLFAHEVGHNWFYGIIGNNETKEAFMDEGFTQFIESWSMERLTDSNGNLRQIGDYVPGSPPYRTDYRENSCFAGYLNLAVAGFENKITTHSDWMSEGFAYGTFAYYKPATMLYNLQYVLGNEIFLKAMREYFATWALKHPHPQDFIDVVHKVSKRDLDWFFEQWLNTTRTCDYRISGVHTSKNSADQKNPYHAEIELKRIGEMMMPLDLRVTLDDGQILNYHIPVDRSFKEEKNISILPKWMGWNDWNRTYTAKMDLPDDISTVEIDPSRRLADVNRMDNRYPFPEIQFILDNPLKQPSGSFYKPQILWHPDLWFNDISGLKVGLKFNLEHPKYFITPLVVTNLNAWFGIRDKKPNLEFNIRTPDKMAGTLAYQSFALNIIEGRALASLNYNKRFTKTLDAQKYYDLSVSLKHFQLFDDSYILDPFRWEKGKINSVNLSISRTHNFEYGQTKNTFNLMTTVMGTDFDFSKITYTGNSNLTLPGLKIKSKIFIGYTRGTVPMQEMFYLAGTSPIDEYTTAYPGAYFRSRGLIPDKLVRDGHAYLEGGTNVRGYQDQNTAGTRALSFNILLLNNKMTDILGLFTPYIFYEIGNVDSEIRSGFILQFFQPFKHDAGFGVNLKLPRIFNLLGLNNIDFSFPVWLSHPLQANILDPSKNEENLKFRWLISFNKTF